MIAKANSPSLGLHQISDFLVECMNKTELIGASNLASLFCTPGMFLLAYKLLVFIPIQLRFSLISLMKSWLICNATNIV